MKVCGFDSTNDFCAKYEKWFRDECYGMPKTEKIGCILNDLGYKALADEYDFEVIQQRFESGADVIIFSHVSLNLTEDSELNHASVLHDISDSQFVLWTTFQNGSSKILPPFEKLLWRTKKCHGLPVSKVGH